MSTANKIREFVFQRYIKPARAQDKETITVCAGDVYKEMEATGSIPKVKDVCHALRTRKFMDTYHVRLVKREGPMNGADTVFIFKLVEESLTRKG